MGLLVRFVLTLQKNKIWTQKQEIIVQNQTN